MSLTRKKMSRLNSMNDEINLDEYLKVKDLLEDAETILARKGLIVKFDMGQNIKWPNITVEWVNSPFN